MMDRDTSPAGLLRQNNLRAKKSWGQCFLGDDDILGRIAQSCLLTPEDSAVELGAGLGHLTRHLAATGARIAAVERDRDLVAILERDLRLPNVHLHAANAAKIDFAAVSGVSRPVVAGNLPYQLTSPILFELLDQRRSVRRAVFLLQKEVAERLASPPGSRDCGVLSVLLASCATVEYLFEVPARHFTPSPRVDSAVIRIEFDETERHHLRDRARFTRLVKVAFAQRRKMLRGALRAAPDLFSNASIEETLARAGIAATARAEELSLDAWIALDNALDA